jgi:hypothetical protein
MRWPWRRRRTAPARPPSDADEAEQARRKAEEDLVRTLEQGDAVREVADQLRQHRRVNHFAELFGQTFEGGQR